MLIIEKSVSEVKSLFLFPMLNVCIIVFDELIAYFPSCTLGFQSIKKVIILASFEYNWLQCLNVAFTQLKVLWQPELKFNVYNVLYHKWKIKVSFYWFLALEGTVEIMLANGPTTICVCVWGLWGNQGSK